MQVEEGVRAMQEAFQNSTVTPHWPMYLRNVKQFIKNSLPTFDEHRYGFHSFLEAVRSGQRAGLFRLERNRQGILRVYPGNQMSQVQRSGASRVLEMPSPGHPSKPYDVEDDITLQQAEPEPTFAAAPDEAVSEPQSQEKAPAVEAVLPAAEEEAEKPARKRRVSAGLKRKTLTPRKATANAPKRPRKKGSPSPEDGSDA
jgi:hypothetical protein